MNRRELVRLLGAAAVLPAICSPVKAAQPGKVYRIGFLWEGPDVFPDALDAFRQGLVDLGYVEGRNLAIEYRWAQGDPDLMRRYAEDLARLKVDVIMAPSSVYTAAAKSATATIPIIFMSHADPLGTGDVASLSRPGGNVTGLSIMMTETNVKGLELFKEAVPTLSRVAVVWDPATPSHGPGLKAVKAAGRSLGIGMLSVAVRSARDFDAAFADIARQQADGLLVLSTPLYIAGAKRLAQLALTHRLPSLFGPVHHVRAGGLMSYSPDRPDLYRRGAAYVDMILKGANPGDLPIQQPTKFEFVINLRTAKTLGLALSPSILARADELIE